MRGVAALLRITGTVVRQLGLMLVHVYDMLSVVGIALDGTVKLIRRPGSAKASSRRREPQPVLNKEAL